MVQSTPSIRSTTVGQLSPAATTIKPTGTTSPAQQAAAANSQSSPVFINVYDLPNLRNVNRCAHPIGFGAYHTAIQVGKYEFSYSGSSMSRQSGIYLNIAKRNHHFAFKFQIAIKSEISTEAVC